MSRFRRCPRSISVIPKWIVETTPPEVLLKGSENFERVGTEESSQTVKRRGGLTAVASRAGFSCEKVDEDRDSVAVHIRARGRLHPASTSTSPQLGVQLKATSVLDPLPDGGFDFRLMRKNYDDLRRRAMVPRILVVFVMPKDPAMWVAMSEGELVFRRCACWSSLLGLPGSWSERYQEIRIDRKNLFTGEALHNLLVKASREGGGHPWHVGQGSSPSGGRAPSP